MSGGQGQGPAGDGVGGQGGQPEEAKGLCTPPRGPSPVVSRCCLFWEPGCRQNEGSWTYAPSTVTDTGPRRSQVWDFPGSSCRSALLGWGQSRPLAKKALPELGHHIPAWWCQLVVPPAHTAERGQPEANLP